MLELIQLLSSPDLSLRGQLTNLVKRPLAKTLLELSDQTVGGSDALILQLAYQLLTHQSLVQLTLLHLSCRHCLGLLHGMHSVLLLDLVQDV